MAQLFPRGRVSHTFQRSYTRLRFRNQVRGSGQNRRQAEHKCPARAAHAAQAAEGDRMISSSAMARRIELLISSRAGSSGRRSSVSSRCWSVERRSSNNSRRIGVTPEAIFRLDAEIKSQGVFLGKIFLFMEYFFQRYAVTPADCIREEPGMDRVESDVKSDLDLLSVSPIRRSRRFSVRLEVLSSIAGKHHVNSSSNAAPGRQA
jgi:hypothetical protein